MLGYWSLVTGNFVILFIAQSHDYTWRHRRRLFPKGKRDRGTINRRHWWQGERSWQTKVTSIPSNQHIRNLVSSKTVCLICPSSFNTTTIQPAIQTKCGNNYTLLLFLQSHPMIILPRWDFLLLPTITSLVLPTITSSPSWDILTVSPPVSVHCSDVAWVILSKDQSDHVTPLLKQQNKNIQLLSIACMIKPCKL